MFVYSIINQELIILKKAKIKNIINWDISKYIKIISYFSYFFNNTIRI